MTFAALCCNSLNVDSAAGERGIGQVARARDAPKVDRAPRDQVAEQASDILPADVDQLDVMLLATWSIDEDAADTPVDQVVEGIGQSKEDTQLDRGKEEIKCNVCI